MVNRNLLNFWLDVVSLLVMLGLALTGGLLHYVLPPGSGHSNLFLGLGRHDFGRVHFYLAVGALFLVTAHVWLHWQWVCSVAVRRNEGAALSRRARGMWGLLLACAIAIVLGGGLLWASGRVEWNRGAAGMHTGRGSVQGTRHPSSGLGWNRFDPAEEENAMPAPVPSHDLPLAIPPPRRPDQAKVEEDCPAGAAIDGRTTLSEAAAACHLSVTQLQSLLRLPENADPTERLGWFKRRYGISMYEVRRLACQ